MKLLLFDHDSLPKGLYSSLVPDWSVDTSRAWPATHACVRGMSLFSLILIGPCLTRATDQTRVHPRTAHTPSQGTLQPLLIGPWTRLSLARGPCPTRESRTADTSQGTLQPLLIGPWTRLWRGSLARGPCTTREPRTAQARALFGITWKYKPSAFVPQYMSLAPMMTRWMLV